MFVDREPAVRGSVLIEQQLSSSSWERRRSPFAFIFRAVVLPGVMAQLAIEAADRGAPKLSRT
jgi:hypothetical protein